MNLSLLSPLLLLFVIFSWLPAPTLAIRKSYVVYLGSQSHGAQPSSDDLDRVTNSHYEFLGSLLGSTKKARDCMFYSYTRNINGFAAVLEDNEAVEIAKRPEVLAVFPNTERKLFTTRSWNFLGLEKDGVVPEGSIWKKAKFGEDIIIGNLDTGVWPESKSFSDEGYGPIPSKWRGVCQNSTDGFQCNKKLIGARYFNHGYASSTGSLNSSFNTARDDEGHGTHTLSTAGGNFVSGANVFGYGNGTAKGGSPKARVAAYKVCWSQGSCFDADIMAAFDAAISDGVDVLSVSLGAAANDYFHDGISIGAFHATKHGIIVVCAAGNDGPTAESVSNVSPWIVTVGASTIDRQFSSVVSLGDKQHLEGVSLSDKSLPTNKWYPLIHSLDARAALAQANESLICLPGSLDAEKVKGKILVCETGGIAPVDKGRQAALAGAVGMILVNDQLRGSAIFADPHLLPASHVNFTDGLSLLAYMNSTESPVASMAPVTTLLGTKPAPFMASFSSRGPNSITKEILKPDITAPGVSILAAYSEGAGPSGQPYDTRRIPYNTQYGTSMSCPHVAGVVGLLKTIYPDWSPAAIRSAIMTTAKTRDNTKNPISDSNRIEVTPFSYGAGHISPNHAMNPGLVYDLNVTDYLNFLCAIGYTQDQIKIFSVEPYNCPESASLLHFNYPSIAVPNLSGSVTITRRLKNVGPPGIYNARVRSPLGISVSVVPNTLKFEKIGEEQKYSLVFKANSSSAMENYVFGELIWSDGKHHVRSPIVVKGE